MLPTLPAPEIVFGLCSAIGTQNTAISDLLEEILKRYSYETAKFKVTDLMTKIELESFPLKSTPVEDRYDSYIKYANQVRKLFGDPGALSALCVIALRNFRRNKKQDPTSYLPSHAYIFDQFKRREEISSLRQIYGRLFITVSIFSDKEKRVRRLADRIAQDHAVAKPLLEQEHAARVLIQRDEDEEGDPHGQRLRDVFPLADVFVNIDDMAQAKKVLERFLAAFFGSNQMSPTREEYGMYLAKTAALRSIDLSRQVGAAICTRQGEVVTLGCNEVPKAEGGTYWAEDKEDAREYTRGKDENERIKRAMIADLIRRLIKMDFIPSNRTEEELVQWVLAETQTKGSMLRDSQLMDLLEFGRNIHAEMSAISDAARLGRSTKGTVLYCTTFPCHICAKHIVASGIERVIYIEPYPKSYAEELHRDSIDIGSAESASNKVKFQPFIGIAPFRFRDLFERSRRKNDDGTLANWVHGVPKPIVPFTIATYLNNEEALTKSFRKTAQELVSAGKVKIDSVLQG